MKYRQLGKTGISLSEIGMGCEGFSGKDPRFAREIFDRAIEGGINCMDLYSPDPLLRESIGSALEGRREGFILQAHLCTVWKDGQYSATREPAEVRRSFEEMLKSLKTDYIDIGMIHYVDSADTWEKIAGGEIMRYALELKKSGVIRSLGISSHNPETALAAVKSGLIDVLMFSVNPCYDLLPGSEDCEALWAEESYSGKLENIDPLREELYETCLERGIGITVMKAFGGGDLLCDESPAGKALTVSQCIHYALTRPAVSAVMVGAHSMDELNAALAYETASEDEKDYAAAFAEFPRISWRGHCMYCGHCAPCTMDIDVALVTKLLKLADGNKGMPETVREHYRALEHPAGECIACGACETRCPFGVEIIKNMERAAEVFGY